MERDESEEMQELLSGSMVCRVKERSEGHTQYLYMLDSSHTLQCLRWYISMTNSKEAALTTLPPNDPSLPTVWKLFTVRCVCSQLVPW